MFSTLEDRCQRIEKILLITINVFWCQSLNIKCGSTKMEINSLMGYFGTKLIRPEKDNAVVQSCQKQMLGVKTIQLME